MTRLCNLFAAAFVILIPFQDFGLKNTSIGILGSSLSVVPLVCLCACGFLRWIVRADWKLPKSALMIGAYAAVLNTVALLRFGTTALDINLIAKTLALTVLTGLWMFVVFGIEYSALPRFGTYLKIAFGFVVFGVLVGDLNIAGLGALVDNSIFHATQNPDVRWRGLASEASQLSTLSISIGLLAAHFSRNKIAKLLLAVSAGLIMIVSGSKGGLLTLAATFVLIAISGRVRFGTVIKAGTLLLPLLFIAALRLASVASVDVFQESTTIATRASAAVWGVQTILSEPFGLGFGGFYAVLAKTLPTAIDLVYRYAPFPLNFGEVESYTVSAESATTKIFLLDLTLFLGLPFVIWFFRFMWKRVRVLPVHSHLLVLMAFWYVAVAMCSYVDGPTTYSLFLVFGVVISEARRLQHTSRCK